MSHEIKERDIQVGIEMAWHGRTRVVETITRENCGILYPISLEPIGYSVNGEFHPTGGFIAVAGDDNLPISKPVSSRYSLFTNEQLFDTVINSLEAAKLNDFEIVSTGTVCNREKVFISIAIGETFRAAGRETAPTLNLINGFGGKLALTARAGYTTIVCANTLAIALGESAGDSITARHTPNSIGKIDNLPAMIESYYKTNEVYKYSLDVMAKESVSASEAEQFFSGILTVKADKPSTQADTVKEQLMNLFYSGAGNSGENKADLFNAVTDLFTHGRADSKRDKFDIFESSEFGSAADTKESVFKVLTGKPVDALGGDYAAIVNRGAKLLAMAS